MYRRHVSLYGSDGESLPVAVGGGLACTITAASLSSTDVAAALASAGDGDVVCLPVGSATWTGAIASNSSPALINVSGKSIVIKGAGSDGSGTNITNGLTDSGGGGDPKGYLLGLTVPGSGNIRVTGVRWLSGTYLRRMIKVTKSSTKSFRIDHNWFDHDGNAICLEFRGPGAGKGLVDHNTFDGDGTFEAIHNYGDGSSEWASGTVNPGSDEAVYVEDNTCNNNRVGDYVGGSLIQSYDGARTVGRHNYLEYSQFDQHGTAGNVGALWWEFYNNQFNIENVHSSNNQSSYLDIRGGSGVIWNNTRTGTHNGGAGNINCREENTGAYPELYQVGRTIGEAAQPAYIWGNTSGSEGIKPGVDGGLVQWDRDVYSDFHGTTSSSGVTVGLLSARPGSATTVQGYFATDVGTDGTLYYWDGANWITYYAPYVYPHPLNV